MAAWLAAHEFVLIGLIWMIVLGPAVGNYACSVVYRLPRGKTPFERHPFCGHCNADLKPIDLAPIISWCMTRGKCRYCAGPIPGIYTVIEVACLIVFVTYFLHFGVGEQFVVYATYAVFVIITAAIQWQQGWIAATIYSYALAFATLGRVLVEHSIYGFIRTGFVMLVLCLCVHRLKNKIMTPFEKPWIWWFTLFGTILPFAFWKCILPVVILRFLVPKEARVILYATAALTYPVILPLLT